MNIISIIIPFKNTPMQWFNKLIESLSKQTNKNFEVFFISCDSSDDDEYKKVIEENNFNYVIVDSDKYKGVGELRDYGVEIANGEYIWFIDSDDWISYDAVNYILSSFIKYSDIDLVMFDYHWVFHETKVKKISTVRYQEIISENVMSKENMRWFHNNYQTDWRVCFKKKFLVENKILHRKNDSIFEDVYYGLIWKMYFNKILLSTRKIYFYNRMNTSSTLNNYCFQSEYLLKAILDSKEYLIENHMFSEVWFYYVLNWVNALIKLKRKNDFDYNVRKLKKEFFSWNNEITSAKNIGINKLWFLINLAKMKII